MKLSDIRIDRLKSIRTIDKQIVISYNLTTLKKVTKDSERIQEDMKYISSMLNDTY